MSTVQSSTDPLAAYKSGSSSSSGSKSSGSSTTASDMQTTFLKLLTTQLQNQDPLNPMDNAQMTSQLAQINTVSGIEKLNTTMAQMMSSFADAQGVQSAALLGKNVLTSGNTLALGEKGGLAGIELGSAADKVMVNIKDSTGQVVATEELGANAAGSFAFIWDGKGADGTAMPQGNYTFDVTASKNGTAVKATALQLGTVTALVRTSTGFNLDLGSQQVAFSDVRQIL